MAGIEKLSTFPSSMGTLNLLWPAMNSLMQYVFSNVTATNSLLVGSMMSLIIISVSNFRVGVLSIDENPFFFVGVVKAESSSIVPFDICS